jgi:hypothetical protein
VLHRTPAQARLRAPESPFCSQHLGQLALGRHLVHNVGAAHELAINIELQCKGTALVLD